MKLHHVLFLITITLFVSCSDDKEYEYYNVGKPITMTKEALRSSVEILPAQNITTSGKIYAYQNYIFINDVDTGIHVIDNSNPAQPTAINFIKLPLNRDISIKSNYLYADSGTDIVVFDISQINNIQMIDRIEEVIYTTYHRSYPDDVAWIDYTEYNAATDVVIGWEVVVERVEVNYDDDVVFETANLSGGDTGSGGSLARFKIVNDHLYVVDNRVINVFDIQNLAMPTKVNEEFVTWDAETIFYENNKLFIGSMTGMYIYDITVPSSPQYISEFSHMRFCDPVVIDGDYAYITLRAGASCINGETQMLESRLEIVNISDIYNPQLEHTYTLNEPYGLGVSGDKLFICDGSYGLKVYDKSDIANLQLLQEFTNATAYDVIPLNDKLLMIGGNTLTQYNYTTTGINMISQFTIQ